MSEQRTVFFFKELRIGRRVGGQQRMNTKILQQRTKQNESEVGSIINTSACTGILRAGSGICFIKLY